MEGFFTDKTDQQALYLSGTYCHKTGTRLPSCQSPRQPTMFDLFLSCDLMIALELINDLAKWSIHELTSLPNINNCGSLIFNISLLRPCLRWKGGWKMVLSIAYTAVIKEDMH